MKQNSTLQKTKKVLLELMETKSFDSIKVTDIVSACGFSRQNFYKHFESKYELVHKIFLSDLCSALSKNMLFDFAESFAQLLREFENNKVFYAGVLRSGAGEFMYQLLFDYTVAAFEAFSRYSSYRVLTETEKQSLRLFAGGAVMFTVRFILGKEKENAETVAKLIKHSIPTEFKHLVKIEGITSEFIIYKALKFGESRFYG